MQEGKEILLEIKAKLMFIALPTLVAAIFSFENWQHHGFPTMS